MTFALRVLIEELDVTLEYTNAHQPIEQFGAYHLRMSLSKTGFNELRLALIQLSGILGPAFLRLDREIELFRSKVSKREMTTGMSRNGVQMTPVNVGVPDYIILELNTIRNLALELKATSVRVENEFLTVINATNVTESEVVQAPLPTARP